MSRLCTICTHPRRLEIDLALVMHSGGYRNIGKRFGVGYQAVYQHDHNHLANSLYLSQGLTAMLSADNLLAKLSDLDQRTLKLLDTAETSGDIRTALSAIRESRGNIEAFARLGPMSELEQRLNTLEQSLSGATTPVDDTAVAQERG